MSAISLKSITGITSITTPAGVDNQLTLHTNNTTEAVKLDTAGNLHFHNHLNITGISTAANFKTGTSNLHNTGLNVQDLDVDGHTNLDNVSIAGVSTFTGAVNGVSARFLSSTNPQIISENSSGGVGVRLKCDNGSAGTISFSDAAADNQGMILYHHAFDRMQFSTNGSERIRILSDGKVGINETSPPQRLTVGGDIQIGFNTPNDAGRQLNFNVNRGSAGQTLANINWQWNSKFVAQIRGIAGSDTTNKDDAHLAFFTSSANNLGEKVRITSAGDVGIGVNDPDAKLEVLEDIFVKGSSGDGSTGIQIRSGSSALSNQHQIRTGGGTGNILFLEAVGSSGVIAMETNGNERLRISPNGQIATRGATGASFNNVGTGDFGSFLTVNGGHTANQWGILSLEGNTSASGYSVGQIQFINQNNANGSSGANVQSRMLARIETFSVTSDSNAGDDSGGALRIFTKPEAAQPAERLRIASDGEIFMGANFGATNRSTLLSISGANQDPAGVWTQVGIYADGGQAVNKGGSIGFGGPDGTNAQSQFSAIKGAKENSTSGNYAGYMAFYTRPAGAVSGERLRITSTGNLKIPDNLKIELGGSQSGSGDFYLNFDGTYATMHSGGNQMNIRSNRIQLGDNGGVLYIDCTDNSTVKLYHQSGGVASEKLSTTSFGIDIPDTLRLSNSFADTGSQMCLGADSSGNCTIAGYNLQIATGNNSSRVNRFLFSHTAFYPAADNTYDLGVYNYRWKDLYVGDAHFSNRDSKNEVDGTWGDWTLQEGESKIFMINNRTGKKYSLVMEEE